MSKENLLFVLLKKSTTALFLFLILTGLLNLSAHATLIISDPPSQVIGVSFPGASGDVAWRASTDAGWLWVSTGPRLGPQDLEVFVDVSGMSSGTHTANVILESDGVDNSPFMVPVTLTISVGGSM